MQEFALAHPVEFTICFVSVFGALLGFFYIAARYL
jgi:hypothetical protein